MTCSKHTDINVSQKESGPPADLQICFASPRWCPKPENMDLVEGGPTRIGSWPLEEATQVVFREKYFHPLASKMTDSDLKYSGYHQIKDNQVTKKKT